MDSYHEEPCAVRMDAISGPTPSYGYEYVNNKRNFLPSELATSDQRMEFNRKYCQSDIFAETGPMNQRRTTEKYMPSTVEHVLGYNYSVPESHRSDNPIYKVN